MKTAEALVGAIIAATLGAIVWLAFQSRHPQDVSPVPAAAPAPIFIPAPTPPPVTPPDLSVQPAPVPWPSPLYPWPWRPWYPFPYPGPGPWGPYRPHHPEPHHPHKEEAEEEGTDKDKAGKPIIGGPVAPDGKTEVACDLPAAEKKKNVGGNDNPNGRNPRHEPGKGSGLCVYTAIEYTARWQNVRPLFELQKYMTRQEGGGWPEKVDRVFKGFAPDVPYGQHTAGDEKVLDAILQSGRMCGVTYNGHDPHYGEGTNIAHMVALVHFDLVWACIADNNHPDDFVWMSRAEFLKRWRGQRGQGGGWVVFLLSPPPPPLPQPAPWLASKPK